MLSTRLTFMATAALMLLSGAARAADYPPPVYTPPEPQPIIVQPAPAVVDCCDGWYLRGHVGVGMTTDFDLSTSPPPPGRYVAKSAGDAFFVGGGIGYNWNSWLRFEGTAEYRARTQFSALGRFTGVGPGTFLDEMEGHLKSWVFLANAFVDLGTWNCFTPFVGLGVGMAYNQMVDWKDVTPLVPGGGISSAYGVGRDNSKWSFAWAAYAGVAYNVTKSFSIDFTYRYLDVGSAQAIIECGGACGQTFKHDFKNLASHDFMIGFRWACCDTPAPPPPVVYAPPPPPLQTRG